MLECIQKSLVLPGGEWGGSSFLWKPALHSPALHPHKPASAGHGFEPVVTCLRQYDTGVLILVVTTGMVGS